MVGVDLLAGNVRVLGGECRHNVQPLLVDVRVALVSGCPVKGAGAEAVELDFVGPNVFVERLEVVFINEAVLENSLC